MQQFISTLWRANSSAVSLGQRDVSGRRMLANDNAAAIRLHILWQQSQFNRNGKVDDGDFILSRFVYRMIVDGGDFVCAIRVDNSVGKSYLFILCCSSCLDRSV